MKINFSWNISESIASLYSIPIPLLEIAKDESLSVIYDNYGKDTFDGMTWYEPRQNRFFIHINTERGNTENSLKGRFTLAHELGHYFIDHHRNAMIHGLMKPHIHRFEPFGKNENWEIEREADDFAANLLMPLSYFMDDIKGKTFSGELIQSLSLKYQVSFSACAIRYMKLNLVPLRLVFAEEGKVKWQLRSVDFPFYRLRYGTNKVPENTVMGDFFYRQDTSCCRKSEMVFAYDCFFTYEIEQNRLQFYEYCIPFEKYAFSIFWQK